MPALPSLLFLAVREPFPARVLICLNLRILLLIRFVVKVLANV